MRVRWKFFDEAADRAVSAGALAREYRFRPAPAFAEGAHQTFALEERGAGAAAFARRAGELDQGLDRRIASRADGFHSNRAGAEPREDVAAARQIEIAPAVGDQPRRCREAAAAQDLVGSEPGLGVLLIRVGHEARIRREDAGGPLPHV